MSLCVCVHVQGCVYVCVLHYKCSCMFSHVCVCVVSMCLHAHVCGVQVFICTNWSDTPQESPTLDLNLQFNAQATLAEQQAPWIGMFSPSKLQDYKHAP